MFPNFASLMPMPQPYGGASSEHEKKGEIPFSNLNNTVFPFSSERADLEDDNRVHGGSHRDDDDKETKFDKKKPFKKDPKKLKKILQKASKQIQKENEKKCNSSWIRLKQLGLLNKQGFFKTKMCTTLQQSGLCNRGDKCVFAHSQSELKPMPNLKKTKICNLFEMGRCNMGSLCSFAHGDEELRSTPDFYKTSLCNSFVRGSCTNGSKCRYAHGEAELRPPYKT